VGCETDAVEVLGGRVVTVVCTVVAVPPHPAPSAAVTSPSTTSSPPLRIVRIPLIEIVGRKAREPSRRA
jgi:hypothetical protein